MADIRVQERSELEADRPPRASWGAVFAGVVVAIGGGWLLHLLGLALGFSIVDATDLGALDDAPGLVTTIWLVLVAAIAHFVGGMLAGRLCGRSDDETGMMHGITVWGMASVIAILLGFFGMRGLLDTSRRLAETTMQTSWNAASSLASGTTEATATTIRGAVSVTRADFWDDPLVTDLQARLKREAAEAVAAREPSGDPDLRAEDIRQAIDELDEQTLREVGRALIHDGPREAERILRENLDLTEREVREIVEGARREVRRMAGLEEGEELDVDTVVSALRSGAAGMIARLDAEGQPQVTRREIDRALAQLDAETLETVTLHLLAGDAARARDALAARTTLREAEITEIVDGVAGPMEDAVTAFRDDLVAASEVVADYVETVLWTAFIGTALSLVTAALGGWMGTDSTRRWGRADPAPTPAVIGSHLPPRHDSPPTFPEPVMRIGLFTLVIIVLLVALLMPNVWIGSIGGLLLLILIILLLMGRV